jgi:hypothetical protein
MPRSPRLLVPLQRPQAYRLRLHHLALVSVQDAEIVDRVQRRRVLRSLRLLLPLQRPQVHRLRLGVHVKLAA